MMSGCRILKKKSLVWAARKRQAFDGAGVKDMAMPQMVALLEAFGQQLA
jgi:hypothetical protein